MVETGTPSVQDMSPEQIASFQYQQENYNDDQRGPVLGTIWSLWVVAVIALVLRFRAKSIMHGKFKLEDILILLGMV